LFYTGNCEVSCVSRISTDTQDMRERFFQNAKDWATIVINSQKSEELDVSEKAKAVELTDLKSYKISQELLKAYRYELAARQAVKEPHKDLDEILKNRTKKELRLSEDEYNYKDQFGITEYEKSVIDKISTEESKRYLEKKAGLFDREFKKYPFCDLLQAIEIENK
jgi:hypothetical protein